MKNLILSIVSITVLLALLYYFGTLIPGIPGKERKRESLQGCKVKKD